MPNNSSIQLIIAIIIIAININGVIANQIIVDNIFFMFIFQTKLIFVRLQVLL